jgi:Zn-dependent protease with chaperone function
VERARRQIEASAVTAFVPLLAVAPISALALVVWWLPAHLLTGVGLGWFVLGFLAIGLALFVRPVQTVVLARLIGARPPSRDERIRLDTAWRSVVQAAGVSPSRYVLAVLPADELNAFACGGHLVVVTTQAVDTLPRDELSGVLAHELSHHLGLHTVALTLVQWLSVPVLMLARIGFFLQSVARAATSSYASHSAALTAVGRVVSFALTAVSWVFLSGVLAANVVANITGKRSEFQADQRAVAMGFGRELSSALRRSLAMNGPRAKQTWRDRARSTHPSARTRVARIDANRRARDVA